jgi:hypothetical protein
MIEKNGGAGMRRIVMANAVSKRECVLLTHKRGEICIPARVDANEPPSFRQKNHSEHERPMQDSDDLRHQAL